MPNKAKRKLQYIKARFHFWLRPWSKGFYDALRIFRGEGPKFGMPNFLFTGEYSEGFLDGTDAAYEAWREEHQSLIVISAY